MADEFVRKDVFDAALGRIEALIDRSLAKQEALASRMREDTNSSISRLREETNNSISKLQQEMSEMCKDMKAISARLDAMYIKLSMNIAVSHVIVTVFGIIVTIVIAAIQLWK
ncbi:MAG: hypothetical protein IJ576_05140 [Synergistaceae bacterium]|nr:hypothetical protein [Synergistaceae bacterium]MBR1603738.1 hypothetical protein [Synergistaceae bacterium]